MSGNSSSRRQFLLTSLTTAGGIIGLSTLISSHQRESSSMTAVAGSGQAPQPTIASSATPALVLPTRVLGQTNLSVPVLGLGGSASPLSRSSDKDLALAIIERAYALGIRYFDTAANYGPSEVYLGEMLPQWRSSVVLATKTSDRTYDGAWRDLERSLKRLQTDSIDLWQFHSITQDWDVDTILDQRQGAIRAAEEAKAQKLIRHVGITGHNNPDIFVKALGRYPFETALIPVNAADIHTPRPFIRHVLPIAQAQNTGIIAMKVPAYGRLLKPGVLDGIQEAIAYSLSQPGVHLCIIAAASVAQLEENIQAAAAFTPLSKDVLQQIEQRTASVWQESSFFRNWG